MKQAMISYPDEFPRLLELTDQDFSRELLFLAAAKLYELGRFTAGQAARLAQMDRLAFLRSLSSVGVPVINLRDEEVDAELQVARELAG